MAHDVKRKEMYSFGDHIGYEYTCECGHTWMHTRNEGALFDGQCPKEARLIREQELDEASSGEGSYHPDALEAAGDKDYIDSLAPTNLDALL